MITKVPREFIDNLDKYLRLKLEALKEVSHGKVKDLWENTEQNLSDIYKDLFNDCSKGIIDDWFYFIIDLSYRIYFTYQTGWVTKNADNMAERLIGEGNFSGVLKEIVDRLSVFDDNGKPFTSVQIILKKIQSTFIYSLKNTDGMDKISKYPTQSLLQDSELVGNILKDIISNMDPIYPNI